MPRSTNVWVNGALQKRQCAADEVVFVRFADSSANSDSIVSIISKSLAPRQGEWIAMLTDRLVGPKALCFLYSAAQHQNLDYNFQTRIAALSCCRLSRKRSASSHSSIGTEQSHLPEKISSLADLVEGYSGTKRNVEQVMLAVRKIEDPEHCHFPRSSMRDAAHLSVQPAPAKLGLTLWIEVHVTAVLF